MQRITLDALTVLDAIARRGSFAAAAESLHRVPSAVTYAVKKLEQDLDVPLFRKQGRRAVLTPAGEVLLAEGRELLAAANRLAETTRQVARGWESRLSVAVDALVDFDIVADGLRRFYQLDSGTEVGVVDETLAGAWEALLSQRADLVVGAPQLPALPAGVITRRLRPVAFVFAVAPDHVLAGMAAPLRAEDIARHRAVVVRDTARERAAMTKRVVAAQPVLAVTTMQQKITAQCRGLGVGYLPGHLIRDEVERGMLVLPAVADPPPPVERVMAWREGSAGRALQWFIEWFSNAASD